MNSQEITVWLDERWVKAIEKHHGRIEDKVNEYLDELINSLPDREYEKISREINTERIREEEMREAAKKYTAFRITENGNTSVFTYEGECDFLDTATVLRTHLGSEKGKTLRDRFFVDRFISEEQFNKLAEKVDSSESKVTHAYDIDLDAGRVAVAGGDNMWRSYSVKDVSTAAYRAFQKDNIDRSVRVGKFNDYLDGREVNCPSQSGDIAKTVLDAVRSKAPIEWKHPIIVQLSENFARRCWRFSEYADAMNYGEATVRVPDKTDRVLTAMIGAGVLNEDDALGIDAAKKIVNGETIMVYPEPKEALERIGYDDLAMKLDDGTQTRSQSWGTMTM